MPNPVPKRKLAVIIDTQLIKGIDELVERGLFRSRSAAIEAALRSNATRTHDDEYEAMVAKLDPEEERALSNERYVGDAFG